MRQVLFILIAPTPPPTSARNPTAEKVMQAFADIVVPEIESSEEQKLLSMV